jgi:hypothetical protein
VGFTVLRPENQVFDRPSWRPEEQVRTLVELPLLAKLRHSRANLWHYPPRSQGRRHVPLVQEEVFLVVEGTFTMLLGDPPEKHVLPPRSIVVVEPGTPLKLMNGDTEGIIFIYGAPADSSAKILEDPMSAAKTVADSTDVPVTLAPP